MGKKYIETSSPIYRKGKTEVGQKYVEIKTDVKVSIQLPFECRYAWKYSLQFLNLIKWDNECLVLYLEISHLLYHGRPASRKCNHDVCLPQHVCCYLIIFKEIPK